MERSMQRAAEVAAIEVDFESWPLVLRGGGAPIISRAHIALRGQRAGLGSQPLRAESHFDTRG
jgi:hypothetical protein